MQEPVPDEQLLRTVMNLIRSRLPIGWTLEREDAFGGAQDAFISLTAPDGRSARILSEIKLGAPSGRQSRDSARRLYEESMASHSIPLMLARYLAPPVRDELQRIGVSYADATGNIMLSAIDPGLYVADRGADKDPWRGVGRPRGTLKGEPAARVVRALLDFSRPWKVRDLIAVSGASTGATYRVLEYLDREGLAERSDEKTWSIPSWERLLRAWAADYNFAVDNVITRYIDPRGIDHFQRSLISGGAKYAITGAIAAHEWTSVAPVRSVFAYVEDATGAALSWGLHPTDSAVNVVLIEPRSGRSFIFDRVGILPDGACRVTASQAAVDLLNGPGRDPQEAEELIRWMRTDEETWRLR